MGFFDKVVGPRTRKGPADMPVELMRKLTCKACPRNTAKDLVHPKMKPTGAKKSACEIYILGEAPGENEDLRGRQFVGKSGKYLRAHIPKMWSKKIRWNNTIRCRPPNNRNPLPQEIICCQPLQESDIEKHKPQVIVATGFIPLSWALDTHKQGIGKWRGRMVPVKIGTHVCWLYPILHPAGVQRKAGTKKYKTETEKIFERDLKVLFKKMRKGLPEPRYIEKDFSEGMTWVEKGNEADLKTIEKWLHKMAKEKICAVDIETKNLRPYYDDSRILSCSVATRKHGTFAFPVSRKGFWRSKKLEKSAIGLLKKFIQNSGKKVCHNTTFEQEWFAYYFGIESILNTTWADTMAIAYVLDSRKGMLNLDVQVMMAFGFNLKSLTDVDPRQDLEAYSIPELMEYNGLDSKWTLELYFLRMKEIRRQKLEAVVDERVRTGASLVGAQIIGTPVNKKAAARLNKKLNRKVEKLQEKFVAVRPVKKFVRKHSYIPNIDSNPDMKKLFGDIMKVKACRTASGGITTADEILSKLDYEKYPIAEIILELRSLTTVRSNVLDALPRVMFPDGRLHTRYGHLFSWSGRLNSSEPNLQNWPKQKWRILRAIIDASMEGLSVVSFDYGQIEARCIAMASQDDAYIKMLWDQYDVHAEWASRIHDEFKGCLKVMGIKGKYSNPKVAKQYRQEVKNKWVFPLFFGSHQYSVMKNLNLPEDVAEYLFAEFWNVFDGVKEWQNELVSLYDRRGYVETLTGRRRYAPCSYNEQINHGIQGTASDIVIDAGNRLQDKGIQFNLNVHDDLTFFMADEDRKIKRIAKEMCRPTFDFINVPLVVEVEAGPNWYKQKPVAEYSSDIDFKFH